ncbi:MAG: site-2 protease family protein [Verrucomicrobiota bacterium]
MPQIDFALGLLWYFVYTYSTVCHEAAHAWAAHKLGDDTAYEGGQVSLDPIPHMKREPVGMILAPIISFFYYAAQGTTWMIGWASAPYDPQWAARNPRHAGLMAMAGPAANLIIAVLAAVFIRVGISAGWFVASSSFQFADFVAPARPEKMLELAATLLGVTFSLNMLLFCFNLLPLPPLDGSCIPLLFLRGSKAEAYQQMMWTPAIQFIGMMVAFRSFGSFFHPILTFFVNLLYQGHAHYS